VERRVGPRLRAGTHEEDRADHQPHEQQPRPWPTPGERGIEASHLAPVPLHRVPVAGASRNPRSGRRRGSFGPSPRECAAEAARTTISAGVRPSSPACSATWNETSGDSLLLGQQRLHRARADAADSLCGLPRVLASVVIGDQWGVALPLAQRGIAIGTTFRRSSRSRRRRPSVAEERHGRPLAIVAIP
jgi:hypothetical protein